ncbi:MAG TPA: hypothetical protein VMV16_09900 [Solirubrobacteraceae bacterium]|nr:hypothetical protein [Solirubrobacteraceae bacterium]
MAVGIAHEKLERAPSIRTRIGRQVPRLRRHWWLATAVGVAVLAALFVTITKARPTYDAMGFMVWGRQALHWNLNLGGAPSWKPLAFLINVPYALAGLGVQEWLWTFTAAAGAGVAVVLAARLAYRLSPAMPGREWTRAVGALVAAYGVATMFGWMHLALIADSDPVIVTLALGAIDAHVSRRPRVTLLLVWLVALGRPEAWPFLLLYAAWLWRRSPSDRWLAVAAVVLAPALWLAVPPLAASSWDQPSKLALGQATVIHGNKLIGVFDRLRTLTGLPMQIAVLASVALAVSRRQRAILALTALAVLWAAVEVAFALHGYSAVQRYLIEPGAVLIVVAGVGVATALSFSSGTQRWLGIAAVAALVLSLAPYTRGTLRTDHGLVSQARHDALVLDRLGAVIADDGGAKRLLACGRPVTRLTYQSTLAWELGLNVGTVDYGRVSADSGPVVRFEPVGSGWRVRVINASAGTTGCTRLSRSDS